ncbi:MAG: hypothetical protein JST83_08615 [Bacteroidetes bacterium]|nr:hypothetical protein [Bacteroidota bacterium]
MELLSQLLALLYALFTNSVFLCFLVILFFIFLIATKNLILSRWHHTFDKKHFSTQEFYENLDAAIKARQIEGLGQRRTTHKEVFLIGARREYLRLYRKSNAFEICTAYVGTGCYVSWWFFEKSTFLRRFFMRIPIIRWFLSKKTYHQVDEEDAFRDIIHACVLEAIDGMTGEKGSTLSESERSILHIGKAFR